MPSCEENKLFVIERTMYNIYNIYVCFTLLETNEEDDGEN